MTDIWLDMVFNVALVGLVTGCSDFDLRNILVPCIQPRAHGVLPGLGIVDPLALDQGLLQFFLDLSLALA